MPSRTTPDVRAGTGWMMPLQSFDILRRNHPKWLSVVDALEACLATTLAAHPEALVEQLRLVQQLPASADVVGVLLEDLAGPWLSSGRLALQCPAGQGTVAEASAYADFSDRVDCDRCGDVHSFDRALIEASLAATNQLRMELKR